MYSEGDILVTNCNNYPLLICKHYGIVAVIDHKLCVFHNTPSRVNKVGGNIVCQPINDFLSDRKVIAVKKTNIKTDKILKYCQPRRNARWNLNYHCISFIRELAKH